MVVSAPNDPDHHTRLLRSGSMCPYPPSTYELPTTCSIARHSTITSKDLPCCWPRLTNSHCLRMSAANRRRRSSPIILYHSIYLIHDDSIFNIDHRSYFFHLHQSRHISIIAFLVASSTARTSSTQQPPANSNISHRPRAPPLSATFNDLPTTFRGDRPFFSAEVISATTRAYVDPSFIFVVVGLCWFIVWVGEGACIRCWCRHVIYCLYPPLGVRAGV
jgi:hypothetical protein